MSKENVGKFYKAITDDENLKAKISEAFEPYTGKEISLEERASLAEKLVLPIAAEQGFDFTLEELRQYEAELSQERTDGELSIDELDAVAGGFGLGAVICLLIGAGAMIAVNGYCTGFGVVI